MDGPEQKALRIAYADYRILHEYIPYSAVDGFLDDINDGYGSWCYLLTEEANIPVTHPGLMLEIWSALVDLIKARYGQDQGLHTVLRRIRVLLDHAIQSVWHTGTVGEGNLQQTCKDHHQWVTV